MVLKQMNSLGYLVHDTINESSSTRIHLPILFCKKLKFIQFSIQMVFGGSKNSCTTFNKGEFILEAICLFHLILNSGSV